VRVAGSYTRANDDDRNATCQALDAALGDGELSTEEHRQRVASATNAATLGELQSLVSDLQIHSAPVQTLKPSARRRGMWVTVAAAVVLVGALIAWGVWPSNPSPSPSPSQNVSAARVGPNTNSPAPAPPQLLTVGGLTSFLAQVRNQFGDAMGYELTVWPDRATLARPDAVNAHKPVNWSFSNGAWINQGASSIPPDSTPADLSKFNVQEVRRVLNGAPQSLHISNPKSTSLVIDSAKDGRLALQIHISDNVDKNGYIAVAADGSVEQIYPAA
jgi:hypothetical protein